MIVLNDFSGGLNLRDSLNLLGANETPNALNWTLDQRGAARLRNGCSNVVSLPGTSGKPAYIFYSEALDQWLCARETAGLPIRLHLWTRPGDLSGSWTDRGDVANTNSLPLVAAFADFSGTTPKVVITSGPGPGTYVGATYTWDGTNLTIVSNTIGGCAMAVWQNRVWIAGYPLSTGTGNVTRIFASKLGDPAGWTAPDLTTIDLRDRDGAIVTGLGIAAGALIAFKRRSAYRINDSATGSFSTLDTAAGSIGPLCVVPLRGNLYTWGNDNIYAWDGIGRGRKVGDKLWPILSGSQAPIGGGMTPLPGGVLVDRVLFAYPSVGSSATYDLLLEYDPSRGWLMKHQLATIGQSISSFARKDQTLYAANATADAMYSVMGSSAGTDAGVAYDGTGGHAGNNYRTPWLQPNNGRLTRILRAQLEGLGASASVFKLRVYKDWDTSTFSEYDLSADLSTALVNLQELTSIVFALGHARSFAFEFRSNGSAAQVNALILDPLLLER